MKARVLIAALFLFAQLSMSWAMPVVSPAGDNAEHAIAASVAVAAEAGCHTDTGDSLHDDCQHCVACGAVLIVAAVMPAALPAVTPFVHFIGAQPFGVRAPPYRPPITS